MSDHRFGPYCPTKRITTSSSSFAHGPFTAAVFVRFFVVLSPSVSSRDPSSSSSQCEVSSGISCLAAIGSENGLRPPLYRAHLSTSVPGCRLPSQVRVFEKISNFCTPVHWFVTTVSRWGKGKTEQQREQSKRFEQRFGILRRTAIDKNAAEAGLQAV